jgi:hypothetical protein
MGIFGLVDSLLRGDGAPVSCLRLGLQALFDDADQIRMLWPSLSERVQRHLGRLSDGLQGSVQDSTRDGLHAGAFDGQDGLDQAACLCLGDG